jgi:hypothetical protein
MRQVLRITSVLLLTIVARGYAQTSHSTAPFFYDIARETTLTGAVTGLFPKAAAPGMLPGAHLTLTTPTSSIDVSLGVFAFDGKGSLSISEGQQIEVTGIMKTLHGRPVFFARLLKVGDNIFAIRNAHGLPVPPNSHERANQEAQNGENR